MKKLFLAVLGLSLVTSSCQEQFDEYGVNPNAPETASASLLLSGAEVATFATYGGQLGRISSVLVQQAAGNQFQYETFGQYVITEADITNEWATIYNGTLINTRTLLDKYGQGNPYYSGMTKVLMALNFGIATDFWGDVPFTEAAQGLQGNFQPKYDKQEDVIKGIQSLLDEAITDLSQPQTANQFLPGADDIIFKGDVKAWTNAAYIIKARYANRLSQIDPVGSATQALAALSKVSPDQPDLNAVFYNIAGSFNQWYDFLSNRAGYIKMGKFFVDYLKSTNDPRLPFFVAKDDNGGYSGLAPEESDNTAASDPGPGVASADSPTPIATYDEARFIEAEAQLRLGKAAEAAAAYNAAVAAAIKRTTGAAIPAAFKQSTASETAATISLEKIINQKYVALFTSPEAYNDWRRTSFPRLKANQESQQKAIPLRLPTSQDERNYNLNATVVSDIYQAVWWDK
ncbi:SusD/RagB family nutrient-binding outer membrane lipoprotein [Spirosoma taeanense]|uniref:SusD/RagB family nutrient-binding outer membrane lipoprotein n=1 Tax=Spirosoma taeanense TaxID=2735870 RepID=A0A6M5YD97_9BACT|nr:SusD/RagB family nutrient-binding outer membrane lipoprotein [Spirosoma taeanense]QJW91270.1 SusD/RagB family nutrient-binding outer membrane lipoprotein [Spirosoma taeanense]